MKILNYLAVTALMLALVPGIAMSDAIAPPLTNLPTTPSEAKAQALAVAKKFATPGTPAYLDAVMAAYQHLKENKSLNTLTKAEVSQTRFSAAIKNPQVLKELIYKPEMINPDLSVDTDQDYPTVVKIVAPSGAWCTGTLIGHHAVLTANHCSCIGLPAQIETGASPTVVGNVTASHQFKPLDCASFMSLTGPQQVAALDKLGGDIAVLTGSDELNPGSYPLYQLGWSAGDGPQFTMVSYGTVFPASSEAKWQGTVIAAPCVPPTGTQAGCGQSELLGHPTRLASANGGAIADICSGDSGAGLLTGPLSQPNRISAIVSRSASGVPAINNQCAGGGGVYEEITPAVVSWLKQFTN
ncbi:trypsin-like serine protease [Paraburkholderia guartelaensis]|uniref:Trypsin-like serine protease n=1 Tax=Paraburkholderia guartelaensis TaxID=2546446 RepID=A0A4R5L5U6_9BURK|nr:trypsin-like serine protease [Paraburkholderia guartelaensis]TDG02997.1 trypsin-like serine protease [Paraburkholderia guartelaensis]